MSSIKVRIQAMIPSTGLSRPRPTPFRAASETTQSAVAAVMTRYSVRAATTSSTAAAATTTWKAATATTSSMTVAAGTCDIDTLIAGAGNDSLFGGDVLVVSGFDQLFSSIA